MSLETAAFRKGRKATFFDEAGALARLASSGYLLDREAARSSSVKAAAAGLAASA